MNKIWLPAFVVISVCHLVGVIFDLEWLRFCCKPLLMPTLALWLAAETQGQKSLLRTGWLIGLAFSTLGDILLMFSGGLYFLLGLSAFLLAHLCYIGAISRGLRDRRGFLIRHPWWMLPFLLYPIALLGWLWPDIPSGMRIPVGVYALVIATMAQSVANLSGHIPRTVFYTMMGGALLFVLSDSFIAIQKFGHPFFGAHVAVISTYIVGQWLLAKSVVALVRPE
jgi:uncharacterized membrane protein YhhN